MSDQDQDQKTEEPTARRLSKAFEEGSVPKSAEVSSWVLLAAGTLTLALVVGPMVKTLGGELTTFLAKPETFDLQGQAGFGFAANVALIIFKALAIPFGILVLAAIGSHLVQHRPTWSSHVFEFNLEKLSPLKGFQRLFGIQGVANFVKSILKLVVVSSAAGAVLWPARHLLITFVDRAPELILPGALALVLKVLGAILAIFAVIAFGDLFFQRMQHHQKLRMTKQEVKDEHKETEGDPKIKAKIRQLRMERSRRRMMQAIPTATVVVTNPTHYAVALRYVEKEMAAPMCVAKGVDELALRLRLAAKEHKVPIVENPPLARALYASVEVDEMIPQDHYKAVAEVIGFVLRLKSRGRPRARIDSRAPGRPRIN